MIYRLCNVPFSSGDKALIRNFEDKPQQGKSGNVIDRDLGNMQH